MTIFLHRIKIESLEGACCRKWKTSCYGDTDMETQIHQLEQEAYSSVLRAFKNQADAITWEKESLITELRKELRLSNEEHRELLGRVIADDMIRRIREWRQAGGLQTGMHSLKQAVHDPIPSPSVSASHKRQKINQSAPSQSFGGLSPLFPSQPVAASHQPSSSDAKRGPVTGAKGKKHKPGLPGVSSMKSTQYPSSGLAGRGQAVNRASSGAARVSEPAEGATFDPLIGNRVKTRWPDDNNFYEAVITDYNPVEGQHALVVISQRSLLRIYNGKVRTLESLVEGVMVDHFMRIGL